MLDIWLELLKELTALELRLDELIELWIELLRLEELILLENEKLLDASELACIELPRLEDMALLLLLEVDDEIPPTDEAMDDIAALDETAKALDAALDETPKLLALEEAGNDELVLLTMPLDDKAPSVDLSPPATHPHKVTKPIAVRARIMGWLIASPLKWVCGTHSHQK